MRCAAVVAVVLAACGSPPPLQKAPTVVAEFDPAARVPKLPLPNLLAVNPDTGLLDVDDPADANDAEKAVNAWLRTLDGFPISSVATLDFSGALDASTVNASTVRVLDVTTGTGAFVTAKSIGYDAERRRLSVSAQWLPGRTYAVAVLSGASGLRGAAGEAVVGTPALDLLRATYPLVTCSDLSDATCRSANPAIRGKTVDDERRKAVKMEKARLAAAVAVSALGEQGIAAADLAAVWSFRTKAESLAAPVVNFEPALRSLPFPCDALLVNGRVALPDEPGDDALITGIKGALARYDGFSTTAAIVTEHESVLPAVGLGLLTSSVSAADFELVDTSTASTPAPFTLTVKTNPDQLVLTPAAPLRGHHTYAVLWKKGAQTVSAGPVATAPAWAMVTAGAAFVDANGQSRVRVLDDGNAADLERLRQSVAVGLAAADARRIARDDLLLAWSFTTQTIGDTLLALREKPREWSLPTAVNDVAPSRQVGLLPTLSSALMKDFSSQVRSGFEGTFVSGDALDPAGTELDLVDPAHPVSSGTEGPFTDATLATPRRLPLKFLLVLPKTPKHADGRIPLIIFQHGITRFRRDALIIANSIAKKGYATLAIDHPLHGDRSYCTSSADCAVGRQCVDHRCPVDGYRLSTDFIDGQIGLPAVSGLKFSSLTNLAATRDQLRQLVIDTAQLIRVVQDTTTGIGGLNVDDPTTAGTTERLETTELGYIGMSLGSVMGALVVAANPEITRATLNVGGASPADILSQASVPFFADRRAQLDAFLLASRGIAKGSQAYDDFFAIGRWVFDVADGQNFGRTYIDEPFPSFPKRRVFLSWVKDDPWVPNPTTQLLIDSIAHATAPASFGEHQWMDSGNHSFMLDPYSPVCLPAQDEAVAWIDAP